MREDAAAKARRLLAEGRLIVKAVNHHGIAARCRGDSGEIHYVTGDPGGWTCSCAALRRCSHIRALQLVTVRPLPGAHGHHLDRTNRPERKGVTQ